MLCLNRKTYRSILFIWLICCTFIGFNGPFVHAQSSSYNLTSSYIVQYGDTLSVIAARYGISIQAIANTNNIRNINNIRIGQVLIIPAGSNGRQAPSVAPTVQPANQVPSQPQISQAEPTQAPANQVQPVPVQPAQVVPTLAQPPHVVPVNPVRGGAASSPPPPTRGEANVSGCSVSPGIHEKIHNVRPGDTLYGISRTYGATVTAVRQRNGLASDRIRVGECLIVPGGATVTPVPDRRRSSEQPLDAHTPTSSPTPVTPVYTAQSQG